MAQVSKWAKGKIIYSLFAANLIQQGPDSGQIKHFFFTSVRVAVILKLLQSTKFPCQINGREHDK